MLRLYICPMKIKRLVIENFKSIERIELVEPNPFTVFVGPNGSGKSNIFEALEFVNLKTKVSDVEELFGGSENYINRNTGNKHVNFEIEVDGLHSQYKEEQGPDYGSIIERDGDSLVLQEIITINNFPLFQQQKLYLDSDQDFEAGSRFYDSFSRLFIGNEKRQKLNLTGGRRLSFSGDNLDRVLKRLLNIDGLKEDLIDWLKLFVPGLNTIQIRSDTLSGIDTLLIYETGSDKPYTRNLISDGTYYILAILTAVYQTSDPQFLCIEEPENGLHPQVLMTLVDFFRQQCEEKGHCIWLNTHSESLVRKLRPEEIILVNKREGSTQIKQIKDRNLYDLQMDEAWLTGALGGGLPW